MLNIDTTTMLIELTRGDTASIVFSAKDKEGRTYLPGVGDVLKFAVAKKVGADPIFEIANPLSSLPTTYEQITLTEDEFNLEKARFYYYDGAEYQNCAEETYDANETYYILDYSGFWTITIGGNNEWYEKDADGQLVYDGDKPIDLFKFKDYAYDVQLKTSTGVDTIIGKTDDISPTFRVLGEVATE